MAVKATSRALACTDVTVRRLVCVVAVALATLAPATAAWADADPASDYLPGFDSYYPVGNTVAKPTQGQLDKLLKIARSRGRPFKVAVIASPPDLGAVTSLYNKPQPYARFLYREISGLIQGAQATLVVVMPAGVGLMGRDAHAAGRKAVAGVKPPAGATPTQVAQTAVTAVENLAASGGHALPHVKPTAAPATATSHSSHRKFLGLLAAAVLLAVALALLLRARALQRAAKPG
jgi:hypothetical protein